MFYPIILFAATSLALAHSPHPNHNPNLAQQPLDPIFPELGHLKQITPSCETSFITAFEQTSGPVPFSPRPSDGPKLLAINETAWEQWFFEGVSDSGASGFVMSFSRDPSYSFFGRGNLRVELYLVQDDGSTVQKLDFANTSMVSICETFTRGEWTAPGRFYAFQLSRLAKEAELEFRTPRGEGRIRLRALTKSRGGFHPLDWSMPMFYMQSSFPASVVSVNMTLSGQQITYEGMGSHIRMWAADGLLKVAEGFQILRGTAGPFSFFLWRPTSRVWKGVRFSSGLLLKNGVAVVVAGEVAQGENQVRLEDTENGLGRRGGLSHDNSTGHIIEFVEASSDRTWKFEVEHVHKHFEMGFGGNYGLTGFTNRVLGGEVGGCLHRGSAWYEGAIFPKTIAAWRVWVVFGVGMLLRWAEAVRGSIGLG